MRQCFFKSPNYLSKLVENIQKRALKNTWPEAAYTEAVQNVGLLTLTERRSDACEKLVKGISEGNPNFPLIHDREVKSTAQYAL